MQCVGGNRLRKLLQSLTGSWQADIEVSQCTVELYVWIIKVGEEVYSCESLS